jgi:hypothetical protein
MAEQPPPGNGARGVPLETLLAMEGAQVDDVSGSSAGKLDGVFADADSGEPAWLLVKLGLFGKAVPVPARDCAAAAGHVWIPYSREDLRAAPTVDSHKPLTREQELEICAGYAIPSDFGRAAEVSTRPPEAVTARPAVA